MNDNPWFKFYPGDWRNNSALQGCSLAARGLWHELLCVMRGCPREGVLEVAGKPMPIARIAQFVAATVEEVSGLLLELEAAGVAKRIDGVLVSRRMIRYAQRRDDGREAVGRRWNGRGGTENATPNRVGLIGKTHRSSGSGSSESDSGVRRASPAKKAVSEPAPLPFASPAFAELWNHWRHHRVELKKPLTSETEAGQLKRLAKEGERQASIRVSRSIDNGWQGLWFPDDPPTLPDHTPARPNGTAYPDRVAREARAAEEVRISRELAQRNGHHKPVIDTTTNTR